MKPKKVDPGDGQYSIEYKHITHESIDRIEDFWRRMIYRKWSLLTGPAVVFGAVAATLLAFDYIFKQKDTFAQSPEKKQGSAQHR